MDNFWARYTPLPYQPSVLLSSASTTSKSSKSENDPFKYYMDMLKDLEGLPNEMEEIATYLAKLHSRLNGFGEISNLQFSNILIKSRLKIALAKFNKEEYAKAYNEVKAKGGLSEIAIEPTTGAVWVQSLQGKDRGKPQQVIVWNYLKNKDKYIPLTNSLLLYIRSHYLSYINDNSIFRTVENGIGSDLLVKMIKERFYSLGSNTSDVTYPYYKSAAKGAELLKGMMESTDLVMPLEGMYEIHRVDKTLKNQIQSALSYVLATLPSNAMSLLLIKGGSKEGALKIIADAITMGSSEDHKQDISYKNTGKGTGSGGSGDPEDKMHVSVPDRWLAGKGNQSQIVINPGTKLFITVDTNSMVLLKHSKEPLSANKSLQDVSESLYAPVLDFNNVSFGGKHVSSAFFKKVAITDNEIYLVDFPVTTDDSGNIIPDLELGDRKQKVDEQLLKQGINVHNLEHRLKYKDKINELYTTNSLKPLLNSNGDYTGAYMQFGVINGVTDSIKSPYTVEVNDDRETEEYERVFTENVGKGYKRPSSSIWSRDKFTKGTIFIPVINNHVNALASENLTPGLLQWLDELSKIILKEEDLRSRWVNANQFDL